MAGISHGLQSDGSWSGSPGSGRLNVQDGFFIPKSSSVEFLLMASPSSPGAWISHEVAQGSKRPGSSLFIS